MNFCDAISLYKKIKRVVWPDSQYILVGKYCLTMPCSPSYWQYSFVTRDGNKTYDSSCVAIIPISDLLALDWQEYIETYTFLTCDLTVF